MTSANLLGALAASLPIVARALPVGELKVESEVACCKKPAGGVEIRVGGRCLGKTPHPPADEYCCEVTVEVPLKPIEVSLEFSGRYLSDSFSHLRSFFISGCP